jgi:uncharacterized protein (TIGR02246 family)
MSTKPSPAETYPAYIKAFNAGDVDAALSHYESQACFVSRSGRVAHGPAGLRKFYTAMLAQEPQMKLEVREVHSISDDLALVIADWTTEVVLASGEVEELSGVATDVWRRQPDGAWKLVIDNPYGVK